MNLNAASLLDSTHCMFYLYSNMNKTRTETIPGRYYHRADKQENSDGYSSSYKVLTQMIL